MKKRHQKTYTDLYAEPIKRNIRWDDVVALIEALGGQVICNEGSRRRFDLNEVSLNIHSPHPHNEIKRYQVKAIREFLRLAGVKL